MHKDKKLLIFNLKENSFDVLEHTLLPFRLQSSGSMMMDLRDWIVDRMLPTYRINADMVYVAFNEPRSREGQIDLAIRTKAASVLDPYWIKSESEDVQYEDVNLFNIEWNKDIPKTLYDFNASFQIKYKDYDVLNLGKRHEEVLIELIRRYNMDGFPKQVKKVTRDIEISEKHRNYILCRIEMLMRKYNGI